MYLIGLTGNIASGKTTVCRMLEDLGARAIDADILAHDAIASGTPAWRGVVDAFGSGILRADGEVDRQKLGAIVFEDEQKLQKLESIVHPAVSAEIWRLLAEATEPVMVIEAVKLTESGLNRYCDALWLVTTPPDEAKRRLMADRRMSESDADLRLAAQPPIREKIKIADVVIDNGKSLQDTRTQVIQAYAKIDPSAGKAKWMYNLSKESQAE